MIKDGRDMVHTIEEGDVRIEIYKIEKDGNTFFDYRSSRRVLKFSDKEGKTPYLQQRDIGNNIRALLSLMDWIHMERRGNILR